MSKILLFPDDWEEFIKKYSFEVGAINNNDSKDLNLLSVWKVKEMIEHYFLQMDKKYSSKDYMIVMEDEGDRTQNFIIKKRGR